MPTFSLKEIADRLAAELIGDGHVVVRRVADLEQAQDGDISFVTSPKYATKLGSCRASAVIVRRELVDRAPCAVLVVDDPYLAFAKVAQWLAPECKPPRGIHPTAVLSASAEIDESASIGPNVVIEDDVKIGADTSIGAGCFIGRGTVIGCRCVLAPNVTIAHECLLGDDVRIQSGTVIGSDGFGYAKDGRRWVRIPQNGKVRIGSGVEIGANCTIDRGALKDTVIEDGVIIDNLVHIAHNVVVGEGCAMAGCVAIAGSTVIGRETTLAGGVGVVGHLNIPPKSHFAARTLVTKSPRHAGAYASGTPMMPYVEWRKAAARFSQLDQMARKLNELERLVGTIQSLRDAED